MAWVYSVTHKESGKIYIGWCSIPVPKRWRIHCTNAFTTSDYKSRFTNNYFYNAVRKDGKEKFLCETIQHVETTNEAKQFEMYWIAHLKEFGVNLYNTTPGGDGTGSGQDHPCHGIPRTEEVKEKLRGENNSRAKLNWTKVNEIKSLLQKGLSDTEIGGLFRVARRTIGDIRRNITWTIPPSPIT